MPFLGGGDYTSGEEEGAPPYTSHQRYFGVNTKVITGQVIPALSYTPVEDWDFISAGMTYTIDIFRITKNRTSSRRGLAAQTRTLNRTLRMRSWRVRPPVHTWAGRPASSSTNTRRLGCVVHPAASSTARVRGPCSQVPGLHG